MAGRPAAFIPRSAQVDAAWSAGQGQPAQEPGVKCSRVRTNAEGVQVVDRVLHVRCQIERQGDRMAVELGREVKLSRRARPGGGAVAAEPRRAHRLVRARAAGSSDPHRTAPHGRAGGWATGPPGRAGPARSGPRASRTGTGVRPHHRSRPARSRQSTATRRTSASREPESRGRRSGTGTAHSRRGSGAGRHPCAASAVRASAWISDRAARPARRSPLVVILGRGRPVRARPWRSWTVSVLT